MKLALRLCYVWELRKATQPPSPSPSQPCGILMPASQAVSGFAEILKGQMHQPCKSPPSDFFCTQLRSTCLGLHFAGVEGRGHPAPIERERPAPTCIHWCFPSWSMTTCISPSGPHDAPGPTLDMMNQESDVSPVQ